MQSFVEAFIMTNGGPGTATLFYGLYLYRQAFEFYRMGYASALAWMIFLIILALDHRKLPRSPLLGLLRG